MTGIYAGALETPQCTPTRPEGLAHFNGFVNSCGINAEATNVRGTYVRGQRSRNAAIF